MGQAGLDLAHTSARDTDNMCYCFFPSLVERGCRLPLAGGNQKMYAQVVSIADFCLVCLGQGYLPQWVLHWQSSEESGNGR
jgi:hypothetical protein